jgi:hypothetical protein
MPIRRSRGGPSARDGRRRFVELTPGHFSPTLSPACALSDSRPRPLRSPTIQRPPLSGIDPSAVGRLDDALAARGRAPVPIAGTDRRASSTPAEHPAGKGDRGAALETRSSRAHPRIRQSSNLRQEYLAPIDRQLQQPRSSASDDAMGPCDSPRRGRGHVPSPRKHRRAKMPPGRDLADGAYAISSPRGCPTRLRSVEPAHALLRALGDADAHVHLARHVGRELERGLAQAAGREARRVPPPSCRLLAVDRVAPPERPALPRLPSRADRGEPGPASSPTRRRLRPR